MRGEPSRSPGIRKRPGGTVESAYSSSRQAARYSVKTSADFLTTASSASALNQLLAALQSAPELEVDIEGHTDADGSDAFNLDLSQRRAASVVAWLVDQGIAAERLQPVGKGEAQPVASNDTADGKALNRRVEVRKR